MFVTSSPSFHPSFPAKPKPLQPIFASTQSQSCTNLGLGTLDHRSYGRGKNHWSEKEGSWSEALAPARPQMAYKSPLQRFGEALRAPLVGPSSVPALDTSPTQADLTRDFVGCSGQGSDAPRGIPTPRNDGYIADTSLLSSLFSSNPRTRAPFKPQKSNRGTSSWQLKQYAEATLGSGSLRKAVKLPEGEDKDEWLAVNGEICL